MKVAVIAGTPIDTRMGIDYLAEKAPEIETVFLPCADSPRDCHIFQMASDEEKKSRMKELFNSAILNGTDRFFIYCNSLSTTIDFKSISAELGVHCVTPLDAYKKIASEYNCVGLIAANNQATAGIEKLFTEENPSCYVMGMGMLKLVENIESGFRKEGLDYLPENIIKRLRILDLCNFFQSNGAQALILGCTHFPYLKNALSSMTTLPVIDPADIMFSLL